ncbi:MAG: hypothetical protein PHE89_07855 [Alphaproteobacteria bacterium]|nr:hypothetical protein [Alphaproteobacteria bacterium]
MPHLDVSTYASQIFWAFTCFIILYLFISAFATPKISGILKERQKLIDGYILKAEEMKKKAESALENYNKAMEHAKLDADNKINNALKELNDFVRNKEREVHKELADKVAQAQEEVKKNKEKALKEANTASTKLALDIIKKIGIQDITESDIKKSV